MNFRYRILTNRSLQRQLLQRLLLLVTLLTPLLLGDETAAAQRVLSMRKKLARQVSVTWQGQRLDVAVARLTSTAQIPYWFDRRVDPRQKVTTQFEDLSLRAALEQITQEKSLGFTALPKLVYIGPEQTARELKALIRQAHNQLKKVPRKTQQRWLHPEKTRWPQFSEPRVLAETWLAAIDVELVRGELIPHDLWAEKALPRLATVERLVLLLAGFDLTCEISTDGKTCTVVELGDLRERGTLPPKRAGRAVGEKTGQGRAKKKSKSVRRGTRDAGAAGDLKQVFTLRLENQPVEKVMEHFARQLKLEIVWPDDPQLRKQLVSCELQNVGLDTLLDEVLKSAGLQYRRDGQQITIQALPNKKAEPKKQSPKGMQL